MKSFLKSILLFTFLAKFVFSIEVTIDPAQTPNPSGYLVDSLQAAFELIYDPQTLTLADSDNTIILAANTAGTTLNLPNLAINASNGGISIIFANTPVAAPTQMTDCESLPIISLSIQNQSSLSLSNLTYFALQGITLITTDVNLTYFIGISNITITNSCIKNTYENPSLLGYSWEINDTTSMTLINSFIYQRTRAGFRIRPVQEILIQNITICQGYWNTENQADQEYYDYAIYIQGWYKGDLTPSTVVSNIDIFCEHGHQHITPSHSMLTVKGEQEVAVSSIHIHDCYFHGMTDSVILIEKTHNAVVSDVSATNMKLNLIYHSTTNAHFSLIRVDSTQNYSISNVYVADLNLIGGNALSPGYGLNLIGFYFNGASRARAVLTNVTIENCEFNGKASLLKVEQSTPETYQACLIKDLTIKNSVVAQSTVITILPQILNTLTNSDVQTFSAENIVIFNTTMKNAGVFRMVSYYQNIFLNELFKFELNGGLLSQVKFIGENEINPFEVLGCEMIIANLIVEQNTFSDCKFATESVKLSTIIFANSTFRDLVVEESASFFDFSLSQTSFITLDWDYYNAEEKILEAEFRPFIVINCSFINIALEPEATFISSGNPMILLINNTFQDISSRASSLVTFGGYIPLTIKPPGYSYGSTYLAIEENILNAPGQAYQAFNAARMELLGYKNNGETPMFFVYVKGNSFVNVSSSEELYIISITDVTIETTAVGFLNNTLDGIFVESENDFNVLKISRFIDAFVVGNPFSNVFGSSSVIKAESTMINNILLDSNSINGIHQGNGYEITASACGNIALSYDRAFEIETQETWINIYCHILQNSISISNANYENISIVSLKNRLNDAVLLKVHASQVTEGTVGSFHMEGCNFTHITIDKASQLYMKDMFNSPIIQLTLSDTVAVIQDSRFQNMSNVPVDSIICVSALNITFKDCVLQNMKFSDDSGGLYLVSTNVSFSNTKFLENQAQEGQNRGGLIKFINPHQTDTLRMNFQGCEFTNNIATLIACEGTAISLNMDNSVISNNCGISAGLISMINVKDSSLNFIGTKFQHQEKTENSIACNYFNFIVVEYSVGSVNVGLDSCQLNILDDFNGQLIVLNGNSQVVLNAESLDYFPMVGSSQITSSFGILKADRFVGTFRNLNVAMMDIAGTKLFSMNCVRREEDLYFGHLILQGSSFKDLNFERANVIHIGVENLLDNDSCGIQLEIQNSNFTNVSSKSNSDNNGLVILSDSGSNIAGKNGDTPFINISESIFQDIAANAGSIYFGLPLYEGALISIEKSTFRSIRTHSEGAGSIIHLQAPTTVDSSSPSSRLLSDDFHQQISIKDSLLSDITSQNGGVLYSNYSSPLTSLVLQDNAFESIIVKERGGILYVNDSKLTATNNIFTLVNASVAGSLIYSEHIQLSLSDFLAQNKLQDSSSDPLGVAFAPNSLGLQIFPTNFGQSQNLSSNDPRLPLFLISDIPTYSLNDYVLQATLQYQDSQTSQVVVTQASSAIIQLNFSFGENLGNKIKSEYCYSSVCNISLEGIQLLGDSNSLVEVTATYQSEGDLQYSAMSRFVIQLRECLPGEITDSVTRTCTPCLAPFYSLNKSDKACQQCPPEVTCYGGSNISLGEGYWRSSTLSDLIIACNDEGVRCKGGYYSNCSEDSTGPVCLQCNTELEYYVQEDGSCKKCSIDGKSVVYGVAIILITLLYQVFVIVTAYKDSNKSFLELREEPASDPSQQRPQKPTTYLTVFITYTQMAAIFSLGASSFITGAFNVANILGNSTTQIFSALQCSLLNVVSDPFGIMKAKILVIILCPVAKLLLILIFELLRFAFDKIRTKPKGERRQLMTFFFMRIGVTIVGLVNLELPGIISVLCDYLSCTRLDPNQDIYYITVNNNIQCGTTEYNYFRNVVVIPALLGYGFLLPLATVFLLYKKRGQLLQSRSLFVAFGIFCSTYGVKAYYWGLSTVGFKIVIFLLNSILRSIEFAKGITLALILHFYYLLYQKVASKLPRELGRVEGWIIRSYLWTIVLILWRGAINVPAFQKIMEVIILLINIATVGVLLFRLLLSYKKDLLPLLSKILGKLGLALKQEKSPRPASSSTENVGNGSQIELVLNENTS